MLLLRRLPDAIHRDPADHNPGPRCRRRGLPPPCQSPVLAPRTSDQNIPQTKSADRHANAHQHFELVSQGDLQTAQSLLSSTIAPEADRLLKETEKHIHRLELKERKLIADSELLETRIANSLKKSGAPGGNAGQKHAATVPTPGPNEDEAMNVEKLKKLKAQRQRLAYAVERLELEKRQKEMQLKKNMSYGA
ncbi:hypothetical protein Dda_0311 [Drechslerella dactyloides]|uniref:DASH complex subunit SPC19 n=1 Tax=Drechslerella dactyloides TaxID=74499 RepID=A0AAD6J612_DREDA|nr:hypothetical protein Dda_0311 [Drechslerella dactyloides]